MACEIQHALAKLLTSFVHIVNHHVEPQGLEHLVEQAGHQALAIRCKHDQVD